MKFKNFIITVKDYVVYTLYILISIFLGVALLVLVVVLTLFIEISDIMYKIISKEFLKKEWVNKLNIELDKFLKL